MLILVYLAPFVLGTLLIPAFPGPRALSNIRYHPGIHRVNHRHSAERMVPKGVVGISPLPCQLR